MSHDLEYTETMVETLEGLQPDDADRIVKKLDSILDFPKHYLKRLKNHPGYRLRVGDFRVLVDWDRDDEMLYAIDVFERKKDYRELGQYRDVWGVWREDD